MGCADFRYVLGDGIYPVNIRIKVGIITGDSAVDALLRENLAACKIVDKCHVLSRTYKFRKFRRLTERLLHTECHCWRSDLTALGVHENDTIGATHTIHSRCRCVLQQRERLDFRRVDIIETALDTIDKYKRRSASGK